MKKHRISKRILAMMLVICMVFTMIPASEYAAYVKGDVVAGEEGVKDFDYNEYTRWPITIHDYFNDGMLFEYASYTGNTASWAQLDKTGEYCYLPELNAQYYADFTTDAINNSQVVRRWFDVYGWNNTASQSTDNVSGLKYYTFKNFDGEHAELIDFRDPDSDDVITWNDKTITYENKLNVGFDNAYGYTFYIDDTDGVIDGGDATIITSADKYNAALNPYWARIVELAPIEGATDTYKVVNTYAGNGSSDAPDESTFNFSWDNKNIVMLVHGDKEGENNKNCNWMDRLAADALKIGDIVTVSEPGGKKVVIVTGKNVSTVDGKEVVTEHDKSGTVSKDSVKYATLVYRTPAAKYTDTVKATLTNLCANKLQWDSTTNYYDLTQIYVFASSTSNDTPSSLVGSETGDMFNYWQSVVLQYDSTSTSWKVVTADLDQTDNTNTAGWSGLGQNKIVLIFRDEAASGDNAAIYNFLQKYAKVGAEFSFSKAFSDLDGASGTISDATLSCTVPLEDEGGMCAYFRDADTGILKSSASVNIPLSGEKATSDWRYQVFDLSNADISGDIQSAGIYLNEKDTRDYDLMVSHFALFDSKEKAEVYGENALVLNKHHMQTIYPHNATYSTDFTTSEVVNVTKLITDWWQIAQFQYYTQGDGTTYETDKYYPSSSSNGRQHYRFTGSYKWNYPEIELIDFESIGGVNKDKLQYAVLICRTADVEDGTEFSLYLRDETDKTNRNDKGYMVGGAQKFSESSGVIGNSEDFIAVQFDLSNISGFSSDQKIYSAGVKLTTYGDSDDQYNYNGFDYGYYFDIRQFAFFEKPEDAEAYIKQIKEYNQYSGVPTSYYNPIYSNLGYGMLVESSEGKLYDKYELPLGYINGGRESHATAEDKIYYLENDEVTNPNGISMESQEYDGYNLFGTLTDGGLTAGLLEGTLGKDRNPVYREETVDYLAKLLETTLVIPEYEGGYFNYDFVRGEKDQAYGEGADGEYRDLASAIRARVGIDFDSNDKTVNDIVKINGIEYTIRDTVTDANGETYDVADYDINNPLEIDGVKYITGVEATNAKVAAGAKLKGTWTECWASITTCYDAAYFLLNSIFVDNSYNKTQDTYKYLTLNKATIPAEDENSKDKDVYIFDAGFSTNGDGEAKAGESALDYDSDNKIIDFANVDSKNYYYTSTDTTTTLFPFLPVTDKNTEEGMTKSPYFADPGVGYDGLYGETYYERDFNYVIESHGEFVYHADDGLFFEFEGDDDVYLFINGQLVLDIGGAHSITKQRFDLNKYVQEAKANNAGNEERNKALSLEENQICQFDFFYMERHGYGANCRIATNMVITDPALRVDKTAYQYIDGQEQEIPYGGVVVAPTEPIEYRFTLENRGDTKLYNLAFKDDDIGVTIDGDKGLQIALVKRRDVCDKDGAPLEAQDLSYKITGYKPLAADDTAENKKTYNRIDGVMVEVTDGTRGAYEYTVFEDKIQSQEALKNLMKKLVADGTEQELDNAQVTHSGSGLWVDATLTIKGIYYKLTPEQIGSGKFNNTLIGEATTKTDAGENGYEKLDSKDMHRVVLPGKPYYYQWAGHDIVITPTKLIGDMEASGEKFNELFNPTKDQIDKGLKALEVGNINKISEVTLSGADLSTLTVSVDNNNNIKVNYPDPYGHLFYLKITYNNWTQEAIVPVVVNTTKVEDSYMVLDYGLSVDLTEKDGILKNDILHVGTEETIAKVVGIAKENPNPSYNGGVGGSHIVDFTNEGEIADANNEDNYDGAFTLVGNKLTYTPDELMEKMDTIWTAVHVHEEETFDAKNNPNGFKAAGLKEEINISKEVQMFKKVSVLPANVVYYEDDFPAIQYGNKKEAVFVVNSYNPNVEDASSKIYAFASESSENNIATITNSNADVFAQFYTVVLEKNDDGKYIVSSAGLATSTGAITTALGEGKIIIMADAKAVGVPFDWFELLKVNDIVTMSTEWADFKDANGNTTVSFEKTGENVFTKEGQGSSSLTQSADQDQEYGQDDEYMTNSDMSGNSLTKITVNTAGVVASFDFKGTGFELISRTNATDSATILVQVTDSNGNRTIPVITEFDHNDDGGEEEIYQVPVIRVDGLTYEHHTVSIYAVPTSANVAAGKDTTLYIDGFRIYNPLAETKVESTGGDSGVATITPGKNEHYNDSENGAVFSEIRNLIMDAKAVVAKYTNTTTTINYGTVTWTERHTDKHYNGTPWEGKEVNSINDYLIFGPNNEVYMDGTDENNTSALVFYVQEAPDAKGKGNLQIAVRAIDKVLFEGTKTSNVASAKLSYGIYKEGDETPYQWKAVETKADAETEDQGTISSATEQYYTINYRECPYISGKGYQVAIKVTDGMVSYSSIKSTGLTFTQMQTSGDNAEAETTTLKFEDGELINPKTNEVAAEGAILLSLRKSLASDVFYEEEISVDEKICYQTRNDLDLRLIGYVDDLTKYSSVSFTLTIDGKTTKPLVCTTAYSGLYANGELYTTKDIYKAEGSFVTFTINNYLNVYRGQEVMITITYTSTTGEVHTEARTVTIE